MTTNLQLVILDDALEPNEILEISKIYDSYTSSRNQNKQLGFSEFVYLENNSNFIFEKFLDYAKKYFLLNQIYGFEYWFNLPESKGKPWHQDYDVNLFKQNNVLKHPPCSIVYYLQVENCVGGVLETNTGYKIEPKTNRLVIFKGDLNHRVTPFNGTRISLVFNPWDYTVDVRSKTQIIKDTLNQYKKLIKKHD